MIFRVRCCRYLYVRSLLDLGCLKSRVDLFFFIYILKSNDLVNYYRVVICRDVVFKVFIFGL